ncbi:hypothetical protein TNCV_1511551 [Trichonephila clavipes]|nr:hypothetical protein TNCV_1511551 [Trichonephila clavipes]
MFHEYSSIEFTSNLGLSINCSKRFPLTKSQFSINQKNVVQFWNSYLEQAMTRYWLQESKTASQQDDEAHFWLNGYVNKQNCHIWSEANPQVYVETPLHPEKLTVWCALWAGGILLQKR